MSSYTARLQLPGRTRIPMNVTVDISDERLSLVTDEKTIGVWPLRDIDVDPRSDGFHLRIDGDEVILTVTDAVGFAKEMNLTMPSPRPPARPAGNSYGSEVTNRVDAGNRIQGRIGGLGQEDQLADVRRQMNDLRTALSDPAIPPAIVFGRWLALLKTLNRRLAQGSMPTPLFFRLNTELLDLMPSPSLAEATSVDSTVAL